MDDMLDLEIQSMNLEMVETTDSGTGYPSHIRNGYIGFESFSDAEEFAYAHGMDVICGQGAIKPTWHSTLKA